jgi:uncharacterized damage-inducible protein DinB
MRTLLPLAAATALALSGFAHAQANTLTDAERTRAIEYLQKTQQEFVAATEGLTEEQWKFKPGADRWSIAECAEHIALTEELIWGMVNGKILKSPAAPEKAAARTNDDEIVAKVESRDKKVQAPEQIKPSGRWSSRDEIVKHFEQTRAAEIAFLRETKADLRSHFAPHPLFKDLDAYQWLLLNGAHGRRHTAQIAEVKASEDYPKK